MARLPAVIAALPFLVVAFLSIGLVWTGLGQVTTMSRAHCQDADGRARFAALVRDDDRIVVSGTAGEACRVAAARAGETWSVPDTWPAQSVTVASGGALDGYVWADAAMIATGLAGSMSRALIAVAAIAVVTALICLAWR